MISENFSAPNWRFSLMAENLFKQRQGKYYSAAESSLRSGTADFTLKVT